MAAGDGSSGGNHQDPFVLFRFVRVLLHKMTSLGDAWLGSALYGGDCSAKLFCMVLCSHGYFSIFAEKGKGRGGKIRGILFVSNMASSVSLLG